jgi:hypothetical protein
MRKRILVIGAMLALSPMAARAAATCDEFEAAMTEGAAKYKAPPPTFRLEHVNSADANNQFFSITMFGAAKYKAPPPTFRLEHVNSADANNQFFSITMFEDARAAMSCWHGEVETFAADGNSTEPMSILHTMLLAGIGLHSYGLEWRQAFQVRDQLVSLAKASDRQASEVHVAGAKVSLVISIVGSPREGTPVGVPTFQIDTDR